MNRFDQQWQKLAAAARPARDEADPAAPYGFAVRVAARAAGLSPVTRWNVVGRFAMRGLAIAALCCAVAASFNFSSAASENSGDDYVASDSIDELLDFSSS